MHVRRVFSVGGALLALVLASIFLVGRNDRTEPLSSAQVARATKQASSAPSSAVPALDSEIARPPTPQPAVPIDEVWENPNSPVHNGDRQRPVVVDLGAGKSVRLYVTQTVQHGGDRWVTIGHTGNEGSAVVLAKVGSAAASAVLDPAGNQNYSVLPSQSGPRVLDHSDIPGCAGTIMASLTNHNRPSVAEAMNVSSDDESFTGLTLPTGGNRVTVAGFYSPATGARLKEFGGIEGMEAQMEVGIQLLNIALARARADAHYELVGLQEIAWTEPVGADGKANSTATIRSFDEAYAKAMEEKKVRFAADHRVGLPGVDADWAGVANRPGQSSVVDPLYLCTSVLAHELGHNLGMSHNAEDSTGSPFAWGYGYWREKDGKTVGTIMSYKGDTLLTYSDPEFTYQGLPMGDLATADNARVARDSAANASKNANGDYRFLGDAWLINESTRGYVGTGADVMIVGLVITGSSPKQVVVRALGPSLTKYGLSGVLANPTLTIYDSAGKALLTNDDWSEGTRAAELTQVGLVPADSKEPAVAHTLAPGAYTVMVSGVTGGTGVALVEAYSVDPERSSFILADKSYSDGSEWFSPVEVGVFDGGAANGQIYSYTSKPADFLVLSTSPFLRYYGPFSDWYLRSGTPLSQHPRQNEIRAFTSFAERAQTVAFVSGTDMIVASPLGAATGEIRIYSLVPNASVSARAPGSLVNLSTRGWVGRGEKSLIAGVVVRGNSPRTYLFRALGENLRQYGINNPFKNITVSIHGSAGLIKEYRTTAAEDRSSLSARNMLPSHATDIAGFVTLSPGAYTFMLSASAESDAGIGLVELYEE